MSIKKLRQAKFSKRKCHSIVSRTASLKMPESDKHSYLPKNWWLRRARVSIKSFLLSKQLFSFSTFSLFSFSRSCPKLGIWIYNAALQTSAVARQTRRFPPNHSNCALGEKNGKSRRMGRERIEPNDESQMKRMEWEEQNEKIHMKSRVKRMVRAP